MKIFKCGSIDTLANAFEECGPSALFRGQTKEYLNADLTPSIVTSFNRHGCIPERMLKWTHYSKALLESFVNNFEQASDLAIDQAILQHYGWRSFFIDATSSPAVASWFAANRYNSQQAIELSEDCNELPLYKVRDYARYEPHTGKGVVYAISRKSLRRNSINAVDLVEITTVQGAPRFLVQDAFMVGPLESLPPDCIVAKIVAPSEILAKFASNAIPNISTEYLFPNEKNDPVLGALLAIPWVKLKQGEEFPIDLFARGLPLPEYFENFVKISHPRTAYYRRHWLSEFWQDDGKIHTYLTNEMIYHGTAPRGNLLPHLYELVRQQKHIALEFDGLAYHPAFSPCSYSKGIYLKLEDDKTIFLTEIIVHQEGSLPKEMGIPRGIYYQVDDLGEWKVTRHDEACDCGDVAHHGQHLMIAKRFEAALKENRFKMVRERVYADSDVEPNSDPWIREQLASDIE